MSAAKCSVFEVWLLGAEKYAVCAGCLQRNAQFSKHRCLELKSKIAVFFWMSAAKCSVFEVSLLGAENQDCSFFWLSAAKFSVFEVSLFGVEN